MLNILRTFERYIIISLIVVMILAILFGTIEVGITIVRQLLHPPIFLIDIDKMLDVFGLVFMILIGLELLETIKTYLTEDQLHVEIVLVVAIIAIARKVIILEVKEYIDSPLTLVGIAAIILALASGYFFVGFIQKKHPSPHHPPKSEV